MAKLSMAERLWEVFEHSVLDYAELGAVWENDYDVTFRRKVKHETIRNLESELEDTAENLILELEHDIRRTLK